MRLRFASALLFCLAFLAAPQAVRAADQYRIGAVFPLSGSLAWLGEYYQKAAQLQVDLINGQGGVDGRPLELVVYDDQSSPEAAARAAQRLISRDRVVALIGTASVPLSGALATVAREQKVPTIVASGYTVDPVSDPFVFNTAHKTDYAVERPFAYFSQKGLKRVAMLMPIGPLGDVGIESARRAAAKHDIELVGTERFNPQSPDLTTQLAQLRARKPDAVFSFVTGEAAAMVARNMKQIRFDVPLLVSHGNATPGFLKMISSLDADILVPSGRLGAPDALDGSEPNARMIADFNRHHVERYKESAKYFSGLAADAVLLVAEGLHRAGTGEGGKLRAAIEAIDEFPGYSGMFHLSATDHHGTSADDLVLLRPTSSGWVLVK